MAEDLTSTVVAWATVTARHAADLASKQARDAYLDARRRELLAGALAEGATQADAAVLAQACVDAAHRIMIELLAQRAGDPRGHG